MGSPSLPSHSHPPSIGWRAHPPGHRAYDQAHTARDTQCRITCPLQHMGPPGASRPLGIPNRECLQGSVFTPPPPGSARLTRPRCPGDLVPCVGNERHICRPPSFAPSAHVQWIMGHTHAVMDPPGALILLLRHLVNKALVWPKPPKSSCMCSDGGPVYGASARSSRSVHPH